LFGTQDSSRAQTKLALLTQFWAQIPKYWPNHSNHRSRLSEIAEKPN
jgi:hypothetical protein